jgi:hypothetical protein
MRIRNCSAALAGLPAVALAEAGLALWFLALGARAGIVEGPPGSSGQVNSTNATYLNGLPASAYAQTNASGVSMSGTFSGSLAGNGAGVSNVVFTNLSFPLGVPNTNLLILSGFTNDPTSGGGTGVVWTNLGWLNGVWNWSGRAYTNSTNGVYLDTSITNILGVPAWFCTNAGHQDVGTPNCVFSTASSAIPQGGTFPIGPMSDGQGNPITGWVAYPTNWVTTNSALVILDPWLAPDLAVMTNLADPWATGHKPQLMVYEDDFAADPDWVANMAMVSGLSTIGQVRVLAIVKCDQTFEPTSGVQVGVEAEETIGDFYGLTCSYGETTNAYFGTYQHQNMRVWSNFPASTHYTSNSPSATPLLRRVLSVAPPNSVSYVITGPLNNYSDLLASPADGISSMTGAQLVSNAVSRLVLMGGKSPGATGIEANMSQASPEALTNFVTLHPQSVPVYWSGAQVQPSTLASNWWPYFGTDNPIYWQLTNGFFNVNSQGAWDQAALLFGAYGPQSWVTNYLAWAPGTNWITLTNGANQWTFTNGAFVLSANQFSLSMRTDPSTLLDLIETIPAAVPTRLACQPYGRRWMPGSAGPIYPHPTNGLVTWTTNQAP